MLDSWYLKAKARAALAELGVLGVLRPRRFRAYGCGAPKTGTHSVAGLFDAHCTGHHIDVYRRVPLANAYLEGGVSKAEVVAFLRRRDRRLWLEMDVGSVTGVLAEPLVEAFPEARFVHTVREPLSWADSVIDQNLNIEVEPKWARLDALMAQAEKTPHTPHDRLLEERGLFSLAAYFGWWRRHNEGVLAAVPEERLWIVRTPEIAERAPEIARFVGVAPESLRPNLAWSFPAPRKHGLLAQLDPAYVEDTAQRICGELTRRFFPEGA